MPSNAGLLGLVVPPAEPNRPAVVEDLVLCDLDVAVRARRTYSHAIGTYRIALDEHVRACRSDPVGRPGDGISENRQVARAIHLQSIRIAFELIELDHIVIVAIPCAFDSLRIRHVRAIAKFEHGVVLVRREARSARTFHAVAGLVNGVELDQVASAQASGGPARRCPIVAGHKDPRRTDVL